MEAVLQIDALALERCFATADVIADEFGDAFSEYALLGLASEREPDRVIATRLLPGQRVTRSTVQQDGRDVLRLQAEIAGLARRMGVRLLPVCFVHRHPEQCDASQVDLEFLTGVFIDQVSTVAGAPRRVPGGPPCGRGREHGERTAPDTEVATAFSLIVNREREHRIYAARSEICLVCEARAVSLVPARLEPGPRFALSAEQERALAVEVNAKLHPEPTPLQELP